MGTTAVQVLSTLDGATSGNSTGVTIQNLGAVTVWLAETQAKTTTAAGYSLGPGQTVFVEIPGSGLPILYAATASGTAQVCTLQG